MTVEAQSDEGGPKIEIDPETERRLKLVVENHPHANIMRCLAIAAHFTAGKYDSDTIFQTLRKIIAGQANHDNPVDARAVTNSDRANMLAEYIERVERETGVRPKLIPLDEDKRSYLVGRATLNNPRNLLFEADEAIELIRKHGAPGFYIYAGRKDHNTEDIAFVALSR